MSAMPLIAVIYAVAAVDYVALFYWFMTFVALAILVASLYRSVNPPSSQPSYFSQPPLMQAPSYFITVQSSDADIRLDLAAESLKSREYATSTRYSYEAAELLLVSAARKLDLETSHTSLADFVNRLSASGIVGLDPRLLSYLDSLKPFENGTVNEGVARRALLIASQLRDYFKQAPIRIQK